MPLWLELLPANDTDWRRLDEDECTLVAAEERARAMIVCKVVTPDGVRIVWSPGAVPGSPRAAGRLSPGELAELRRLSDRDLAELALIGGRRG